MPSVFSPLLEHKEPAVNHIDLDTQGEAVKQFVLSLPADPDGAVLELNGRAVARLIPVAATGNGHSDDGEWSEEKNRRRCQLIDRKYDSSLTATEEAELAALQNAMHRHVDRVAPLPIEATRKLHQQLLEKAMKGHTETEV
jgi:hypothetical protein